MFMRDICSSVEVLAVLKMRWTERLYDIYMGTVPISRRRSTAM